MSEKDELVLFPVAGWDVGTIPSLDAIFVRLPFLSHPLQKMDEADPGRRYVFQTKQLRELISALQKALQKLETSSVPIPDNEKH